MTCVIDCENKKVYYYVFEDGICEKENVKLSDVDFNILRVLSNNSTNSLQELSVFIKLKKFAYNEQLDTYKRRAYYYENIRQVIYKLKRKGFNIKRINNIGYRLEDTIYVK